MTDGTASSETSAPPAADARGLGQLAARSAQSLLVITMGQRAVSLLNILLLPRLLSVDDFGPIGSALAMAGLFGVLGDSGIQLATVKLMSRAIQRGESAARTVGAALIVRAATGAAAVGIGCGILWLGPFSAVVRVAGTIALVALVNPFWCVYGAALQAHFRLSRLRALTLTMTAVTAVVSLAVAAAHGGAVGVVSAQTAISIAMTPLVIRLGRASQRADLRCRLSEIWELLATAWRLGASGVLAVLYYRFDTILLTALSTSTEVALYYASYRLTEAASLLPQVIVLAMFPALSRLVHGDHAGAVALAQRVIRIIAWLGVVLSVAGMVAAAPAVRVIYGSQYVAAVHIVQTLLPATLLIFVNLVVYQVAVAFGRTNLLLIGSAVGAVVNVAANLALVPGLHAEGAAIATVLTEMSVLITALPWVLRTLPAGPGLLAGRAVLVAAAMVVAAGVSRIGPAPVLVLAALPLGLGAATAARILDRRLIAELVRLIPRPASRRTQA